jgi:hypothetical protein
MEKQEIKEYHVREIKEYHVRARGKVRFYVSTISPFRIETAVLLFHSKEPFIVPSLLGVGRALKLSRIDYKMISVPEKSATTVAHPMRCASAAVIEAETGGCE